MGLGADTAMGQVCSRSLAPSKAHARAQRGGSLRAERPGGKERGRAEGGLASETPSRSPAVPTAPR